jgi:hypothetical protein
MGSRIFRRVHELYGQPTKFVDVISGGTVSPSPTKLGTSRQSAVIVIALKTGKVRHLMQKQVALQAEDRDIKIDGASIQLGG